MEDEDSNSNEIGKGHNENSADTASGINSNRNNSSDSIKKTAYRGKNSTPGAVPMSNVATLDTSAAAGGGGSAAAAGQQDGRRTDADMLRHAKSLMAYPAAKPKQAAQDQKQASSPPMVATATRQDRSNDSEMLRHAKSLMAYPAGKPKHKQQERDTSSLPMTTTSPATATALATADRGQQKMAKFVAGRQGASPMESTPGAQHVAMDNSHADDAGVATPSVAAARGQQAQQPGMTAVAEPGRGQEKLAKFTRITGREAVSCGTRQAPRTETTRSTAPLEPPTPVSFAKILAEVDSATADAVAPLSTLATTATSGHAVLQDTAKMSSVADLAVAQAVAEEDPDLPRAQEYDPATSNTTANNATKTRNALFILTGAAFVLVVLAVVLVVTLTGKNERATLPTIADTAAPTSMSREMFLKSLLPSYTLETLERDAAVGDLASLSPQALALDFLVQDQSLEE